MPVHVLFQEVLREDMVVPVRVDVTRIEAYRRGTSLHDKKGVGTVLTMYSGQRIAVQESFERLEKVYACMAVQIEELVEAATS